MRFQMRHLYWILTGPSFAVHTVRTKKEGYQIHGWLRGKPKCENFSLAFFTLSESFWVGDIWTEPKNPFFNI
jgi:hypothetical protein